MSPGRRDIDTKTEGLGSLRDFIGHAEKVLTLSGCLTFLYAIVAWTNLGPFVFAFFIGGASSCVFATWYLSTLSYSYFKNVREADRTSMIGKLLKLVFSDTRDWRREEPVRAKDEPEGPFSFACGTSASCPMPPVNATGGDSGGIVIGRTMPGVAIGVTAKTDTPAAIAKSDQAPADVPVLRFETTHMCQQCRFDIPLLDVVDYKGKWYHTKCVDKAIVMEGVTATQCALCDISFANAVSVRYRDRFYHPACLHIRLKAGEGSKPVASASKTDGSR